MTKKAKINYLLGFVSESQKNLFFRMHKSVDDIEMIDHAIMQIENTLNGNAKASTRLRESNENHKEQVENLKVEHYAHVKDIKRKHEDHVQKLKDNNANQSGYDIQKRLDKLDALEAGGVDNWEWHDESLTEWYEMY